MECHEGTTILVRGQGGDTPTVLAMSRNGAPAGANGEGEQQRNDVHVRKGAHRDVAGHQVSEVS